MERYSTRLGVDAFKWMDEVKEVDELPFECVKLLGHGSNCSVYTLMHVEECAEESNESIDDDESSEPEHWVNALYGQNDMDTMSDVSTASSDVMSDSDGSTDTSWENVCSQPITSDSPMGTVEVVAKRFSDVDLDRCFTAHNPKTRTRLRIDSDAEEFVEWLAGQERPVDVKIITEHITPSKACFGDLISESLCQLTLTDLVSKGMTPNIIMAFRAFVCDGRGFLIQERITGTLDEVLEENPGMTSRDIASAYLQVFVTLHMLQETCDFKHHDLHPGNVFMKRIDDTMVWKGQKMCEATHFTYDLGEHGVLTFPNNGYIVKIGDFGLSSMTLHGRRIQSLSMGTYARGASWGEWSASLEGGHGYDGQTVMASPPFERDSPRIDDADTIALLRRLRASTQGPNGRLTKGRYRPKAGHVSDVRPLEVIKQVFLDEPDACADFREPPPDDAVVMCLSSVTDLVSTPARTSTSNKRRRRTRHA